MVLFMGLDKYIKRTKKFPLNLGRKRGITMRKWIENCKWKIQRWMYGRYGQDELSVFLVILSIVIWMASHFSRIYGLGLAAWLVLVWATFRCYSRKTDRRRQENIKFLRITEKPRNWFGLRRNKWRDRKTHRYFKCKNCGAVLRVPKGRGKIEITCPKCRTTTIKKT